MIMERFLSFGWAIPLAINMFLMLVVKYFLVGIYDASSGVAGYGLVKGVLLSNRMKLILLHPPLWKKVKLMRIPLHTIILVSTMHICAIFATASYIFQDVSEIFSVHGVIFGYIWLGAFILELIMAKSTERIYQ